MSDIALRVDNLSKRYRIGVSSHGAFRYKALRDSIADFGTKTSQVSKTCEV